MTAAACGEGSDAVSIDASSSVTDSTTASATSQPFDDGADDDSLGRLVSGLAGLAVSTDHHGALVDAGCDAWVPEARRGDAGSFNEWIYDLFGRGSAGFSFADVDAAVTQACAEQRANPTAFVASMLSNLGLAVDQLLALVGDACERYVQNRIANIDDPYAPEPIGDLVASVLEDAGISRSEALEAVNDFCDVPDGDSYQAPPSVLPDLTLTPGSVSPEFDLATTCTDRPEPPPIPTEAANHTVDVYQTGPSDVEVQRLIPFALGGTTNPDNLFPIPTAEHPGASDKPEVDRLVVELVCDGAVFVDDARAALIINWPTAFATLNH